MLRQPTGPDEVPPGPPLADRDFNPLGAIIGVVLRPAATMKDVAVASPWRTAVVLNVTYPLVFYLTSLAASLVQVNRPGLSASNDHVAVVMTAFLNSPRFRIGIVIAYPLVALAFTGVFMWMGRRLGGRGSVRSLYSTTTYAIIPFFVTIPLGVLFQFGAGHLGVVPDLVNDLFMIWCSALTVLAIRASLGLSTKRAIATYVIPLIVIGIAAVAALVYIFSRVGPPSSSA